MVDAADDGRRLSSEPARGNGRRKGWAIPNACRARTRKEAVAGPASWPGVTSVWRLQGMRDGGRGCGIGRPAAGARG